MYTSSLIVQVSLLSLCSSLKVISGDTDSYVPKNEGFENNFKIINGVAASKGEFPYAAFIYTELEQGANICAGSLISSNVIVTAAHCLFQGTTKTDVNSIFVSVGSLNSIKSNKNVHQVYQTIPHPGYNMYTAQNDIGIIILSGKTNLPESSYAKIYDLKIENNSSVKAAGWGLTSNTDDSSIPDTLMSVSLNISSSKECKTFNPNWLNNNEATVCVAAIDGKDTCYGDSGGPLSFSGDPSLPLIGVTSFGNSPSGLEKLQNRSLKRQAPQTQDKPSCGDEGGYSFYTRVYYYIDWISKVTKIPAKDLVYSTKNLPDDQNSAPNASPSIKSKADVYYSTKSITQLPSSTIQLNTKQTISDSSYTTISDLLDETPADLTPTSSSSTKQSQVITTVSKLSGSISSRTLISLDSSEANIPIFPYISSSNNSGNRMEHTSFFE
ncbi:Trypsin epsilon [Smittium culicis]|uniref:Trypsin epsilon n=1 Tax=Smittium culicis TaxID=133412 RepID=A0A1R1XXH9_9FUNG|nr:Trypsin epsilon [Smittium culicis]